MSTMFNKAGRFLAEPADWSLDKRENGTPFFKIEFLVTAQPANDGWQDCRRDDQRITGYFTLITRDKKPNTVMIDQLKEAIGWDGDLGSLHHGDWSKIEVQIVTEYERWENKDRLKVKWIYPADYVPGLKRLNDHDADALASTWGPIFRAATPQTPKRAEPSAGGAPAEVTPEKIPY